MSGRELDKQQFQIVEQSEPLLANRQNARQASTESESSIPYMDRLNDSSESSDTSSFVSTTSDNVSKNKTTESKNAILGPTGRRNVHMPIIVQVDEKDHRYVTEGTNDSTDSPEILANVEPMGRNLRRNSISLPMGIDAVDLEGLRLKYQMQDQDALSEEEKSESRSESVSTFTFI